MALKTSAVVGVRGMFLLYSHMGICQADVTNLRVRWMNTTYIELVVDGDFVDLNRIPLPVDTPIIDERFKEGQNK
jgi:hypothetical protein